MFVLVRFPTAFALQTTVVTKINSKVKWLQWEEAAFDNTPQRRESAPNQYKSLNPALLHCWKHNGVKCEISLWQMWLFVTVSLQ